MDRFLRGLVEDLLEDAELFGPQGACPARYEDGAHQRLLLITGGNASGKSFACRYLDQLAGASKTEFMRIGMAKRTQAGIERSFIFGDEATSSTGTISAKVLRSGESTCRSRSHGHVICFDEPDIGMSEETAEAAGLFLARFGATLPEKTLGMVVVTHSRPIARHLMGLDPMRLRCGDDQRATSEWLTQGALPASEADLEAMHETARRRRSAIQAVLNARRDERSLVPLAPRTEVGEHSSITPP